MDGVLKLDSFYFFFKVVNMIEVKNLRYCKPSNNPWEFKVDRTSPVGNPFYMVSEEKRDEVCDKYEAFFKKQIVVEGSFRDYAYKILKALKTYGKVTLYCWCPPKRCHAETIKRWLEGKLQIHSYF